MRSLRNVFSVECVFYKKVCSIESDLTSPTTSICSPNDTSLELFANTVGDSCFPLAPGEFALFRWPASPLHSENMILINDDDDDDDAYAYEAEV